MSLVANIEQMKKNATESIKSAHFTAYYEKIKRKDGPSRTVDSIRSPIWVLSCLEAAERAYKILSSRPWMTPKRKKPKQKQIPIYLVNISKYFPWNWAPFCAPYENEVIIVLPCQCNTATQREAFDYIYGTTIHEVAHVFSFQHRPFAAEISHKWLWFDEGFSVFMEHHVRWGSPDYFLFVRNWIDQPDVPFVSEKGMYQAMMLVSFLTHRLSYEFVNSIWTKAYDEETPLEAINRLLGAKGTNFCDIFMEYCLSGYFLRDPQKHLFSTEIFRRFGNRAIAYSFTIHPDKSMPKYKALGYLLHLGCRYYRFFCEDMDRLEVTIRVMQPFNSFHAQMAITTNDKRCEKVVTLPGAQSGTNLEEYVYTAIINGLKKKTVNYVILVVSNCGVPAPGEPFPTLQQFDLMDDVKYEIDAKGYR